MARKAQTIESSRLVKKLIKSELKKGSIGCRYQKRLHIIDMALMGLENKRIGSVVGFDVKSVRKWRSKWASHMEELTVLESDFSGDKKLNKVLLERIKHILSDHARCGSPRRITHSERLRIQALACESPGDYGLPYTNWTHRHLSDVLKGMDIEVSRSQVGVILKRRPATP